MTSPLGIPDMRPMANTHHPQSGPLDPDLVWRIRNRPPAERLPLDRIPQVGDRVGVRMEEGGPVLAAVVTARQSWTLPYPGYREGVWPPPENQGPDPNVWRVVVDPSTRQPVPRADGREGYVYELVDDPWPTLTVRIDPPTDSQGRIRVKRARRFTELREERIPPWGGWLFADAINDPGERAEPEVPTVRAGR